jgi:hypothetical protein
MFYKDRADDICSKCSKLGYNSYESCLESLKCIFYRKEHKMSEVGQPAQCKWRPLIGQYEITAYVMSAGRSLSSFSILIAFVAFSS